MTTEEMVDMTKMATIYNHYENDPEISVIVQVEDNNKELLIETGQILIDGDIPTLDKKLKEGKVRFLTTKSVPPTNSVYCLYLPPMYLFTDLKREHK